MTEGVDCTLPPLELLAEDRGVTLEPSSACIGVCSSLVGEVVRRGLAGVVAALGRFVRTGGLVTGPLGARRGVNGDPVPLLWATVGFNGLPEAPGVPCRRVDMVSDPVYRALLKADDRDCIVTDGVHVAILLSRLDRL